MKIERYYYFDYRVIVTRVSNCMIYNFFYDTNVFIINYKLGIELSSICIQKEDLLDKINNF